MPNEWLNDRNGNPVAMYRPGEGWVTGQNWSHWDEIDGTKWGSRSNLTELSNDNYTKGRDAQIANTGSYVLGSVGGSSDPYFRSFDPSGLDLSGMTPQQRQMFDPNSTWGNSGYVNWGDPNNPSVGRPDTRYNKMNFQGDEDDSFGMNTLKTAFGQDEAGAGVGAGTILAMWLAAGAAAGAGAAGAGGADAATAAGAMGGAEGAAAGAGGYGGAAGGNWWDNLFSGSNNYGLSDLDVSGISGGGDPTGGGMPEFDFSGGDFDWSSFGDFGGGGGTQMPPAIPETTQQLTDWGMTEISPGNWAMPGEVAGTLYEPLVQKFGEQAAKSLLSQLMSGNASASDYAKVLGQLAATGLGMYGANQQSNQMNELAQRYEGYGAPYRARLAQSYADPSGFLANSPDIQASVNQGTNALARSLSRQGNPTGSGAALHELQNYATQGLYGQLGNERNRLANFGGMSNFNAAAPGLAGQAIGAQGGALNALGSGISSITNPPTTLEQALNSLNGMSGLKLNSGMGI